jgi:photosystem II stability/assembly factor-like uncharacterized protein
MPNVQEDPRVFTTGASRQATFFAAVVSAAVLLGAAAPASAAPGRWTPFGPEGGGPTLIAADPHSPRLYAAFPWGPDTLTETLVMRSDDGGASWQESNGGLEGKRLIALASDPSDSSHAFAVVAVEGCFSGDPGGVYRTADAGAHWEIAATSEQLGGLSCAAGLLALPDAVLVGAQNGVARSSDGGTTWQTIPLLPAPGIVHTLLRDPADEHTLYAAGPSSLFKSSDGGLTWTPLDNPATHLDLPIRGLAISPSDPGTLYEAAYGSLWRSRDGGATWSTATAAPTGFELYVGPLLVDPHNPDVLFLGTGEGVWASRDGGATFHLLHRGLETGTSDPRYVTVNALTVDAAQRILLGTRKGLWTSTDAGYHWTAAALHGVHANEIRFLRFDPFDPRHFLFASFDTLFETHDDGGTFTPLSPPGTGSLLAIEFDPFHRGRLVALMVQGEAAYRVFTSGDGGHQWGAPSAAPRGAVDLAVPTPDSLLVATDFLWVYLRQGANGAWREVLQGTSSDDRGTFTFSRLLSDPYRRTTVFALGFDHILHGATIPVWYRSLDAGLHWSHWQDDSSALALDPRQTNTAYTAPVGTFDRISIDTGKSRRLGKLTPLDLVDVLLVDRTDPKTFYAATANTGVQVSHDTARHWSDLAPGLPLAGKDPLTDLEQDRASPLRLYATPVTGGLWRLDLVPQ